MFLRQIVRVSFAAVLIAAALPVLSQVAPQGGRHDPFWLIAGTGISSYDSNINGRLLGPTAWADLDFNLGPWFLRGFGLEGEWRDLRYARTGNVPELRENSFGGGGIYTWRHYHTIHPYVNFLWEKGSIDFNPVPPSTYDHDTRTFYAPGGGVDVRAWRNVWVRGDYQYQIWNQDPLDANKNLTPQGFTIGLSYDLMHIRGY